MQSFKLIGKKIGTDENDNEGTFSGATPFTSTTMPAGDTFIPYNQLTEEIVLGWIKDAVVDGPAPPPIGAKELCRIVINTNTVHGEDPIVTIGNALKAKFPEGAFTEVTS